MPYVRLMVSQTAPCGDVDALQARLVAALPEVVSNALSVSEESTFPPTEVTIDSQVLETPSPRDAGFDRMSDDVEILILCDRYPERVERRHKIAQTILDGIDGILDKCSAWVYLRPDDSGFARRSRKE